MLHYFLTGEPASREAALGLAQWVVNMEDGRKTPLRWLTSGNTGLSSGAEMDVYQGPSRGSANSLKTLVNAARLTGEQRWLRQAEVIIRRCIHPADDIERRNLLIDREDRWFYVMFLQSLGDYLDCKAERGDLDAMYAYGRASLLHYARWMARYEFPAMEEPARLQYPSETWVAQEMRKSETLKYAALHSSGEERRRFLERATFFYHYTTSTLLTMPTRTFARPIVLMLSMGFMEDWFHRHPERTAPAAPDDVDFGQPAVFVSQKFTAKRRLIGIAAAVLASFVVMVVYLAARFLR
jgi:hypothetical protein